MESFFLVATNKTPEVDLNPDNHVLTFSGRSLPENSEKFYRPIKDWIIEYFNTFPEASFLNFNLKYYNTSSSKMILEILMLI